MWIPFIKSWKDMCYMFFREFTDEFDFICVMRCCNFIISWAVSRNKGYVIYTGKPRAYCDYARFEEREEAFQFPIFVGNRKVSSGSLLPSSQRVEWTNQIDYCFILTESSLIVRRLWLFFFLYNGARKLNCLVVYWPL